MLCPWAKQEALHALSLVAPRKGRLLRRPQRRPPSDGEAAKTRDSKTTNFIFSELPSFVRKVLSGSSEAERSSSCRRSLKRRLSGKRMVWHSRWIEGIRDQSGGKTVLVYVARKEKGDQTSIPTKTGLFQSPALSESRRSAEGIDGTKKMRARSIPQQEVFFRVDYCLFTKEKVVQRSKKRTNVF